MLSEINRRENQLFRLYCGYIPEANVELNDLQREKIAVVCENNNGRVYIGKINRCGEEWAALTADTVYTEYTSRKVCNFEADFVVPTADVALAEMIVKWNTKAESVPISRIIKRVERIGGAYLIWS